MYQKLIENPSFQIFNVYYAVKNNAWVYNLYVSTACTIILFKTI